MDNELVSVVIATYNRDVDVLRRSLDSVMRQTYAPIEVIVVDDNGPGQAACSQALEALLSQCYPSVRYIKRGVNRGAQYSRNEGVQSATGEWIALLDDDDEWMPYKIEKQMEKCQDSVGLVYCMGYSRIIGSDGTVQMKPYATTASFKDEVTFDDLLYADYIGTTTQVLIRKSVLKDAGMFDLDQPARQDYELWLRISRKARCVGVREPLFIHNVYAGDRISADLAKAFKGLENIYRKYAQEYSKRPFAASHALQQMYAIARRQKNFHLQARLAGQICLKALAALLREPKLLTEIMIKKRRSR